MKVIYIHQHFSTKKGSTGTRSYEMSQCLISAGHEVTMICGAYDASDLKSDLRKKVSEYDVDGIHVVRIDEPYSNIMNFARRVLAFGRFARTATKVIKKLDADIVFATSTPLTVGIPGMKGARHHSVPFVFEVRDLWPELMIAMDIIKNPIIVWYLQRFERKIYKAASRIIALAPGIKEGICRTGYPADRIVVIPNSSDMNLFKPSEGQLRDKRFGDGDDFRLIFTGAHGLANGLDAVLDAAAELKKRGEKGIRFVFIGKGSQRERLIARSKKEGLDFLVSWVPLIPKEELAQILPMMDIGMMILKNVPSFYYGTSPNKFFDYISAGLPVLNNYPGWLADTINANKCGIAVQPDDPKAFADAAVWMRDHRDEIRSMGERSRQLAESEFSRDKLGTMFVQTLEEAYETRRRK